MRGQNAVISCYFKPEEQDSNFGVLSCSGFCPRNFTLSWPKLIGSRNEGVTVAEACDIGCRPLVNVGSTDAM